jgi:2-phosphosulfolactate phosphatase
VVEANFATAGAVAQWVAALQKEQGRRLSIAIVAAGERRPAGDIRFAVEDQLAAGAVIDRLAQAGLDATSPEAAAAEGAFLHLQRAVGHLLTASVTATGSSETLSAASFRVDETLTRQDVEPVRDLA